MRISSALALMAGLLAIWQLSATGSDTGGAEFGAAPSSEQQSTAVSGKPLLRHVVMFQFKESSSDEEVQTVVDVFAALPNKISEIAALEFGENNSPEGLNDGLTHCFLVSFASEADRATYLPHPAHQAFVEILKPHLEKVVVIDYWAGK